MKKRKSILTSIANRASTTALKSPKTRAMTVSQNPAIQIPTNQSLKESCRVLCNRCFALTRGVTCLFCDLDYPCPHMPGLEEQVAIAHKLRKEIEKNG